MLTALRHNDLVAWHENLGNRRIDHQRVISSGPWARIGELTDLDQDGDLDAPMSLPLSSGFAWLPSFGSGAFSKPTTVDVEYGYTGGVVMDLDSDAHPDIVFSGATEPGSIDWSRGTSDGPTTTPVPLVDSEVQLRNLTAADLDGDGDSDLLGTAYLDGRVFAFENLGGGQLAAQRVIATLGGDYAYIEKSVDFDLDGDVDLLVRQGFQARLILLENDGSGRIVARHALPTLSDSVVSLGLADLDGDSDPDLYYTGYYEGRFAWLENLGFGRFAAERALWTQDAGVWYATTGDLDADGEPDIVFSANDEAMVGAVMNLGGGQFGPERVLWVGDSGVEPYNAVLGDVHVVDVDQDGDADIVSNGSFHHPLFWLENRTDLVGTVRCSGDDADALDCPCGNQSGSGTSEGCRNSTGRGARLFAHGTTDLATDDLRLRITRAPSHGAAMFVQGESLVTAPFRDGVLCAGNPVARLQVVPVDAEGGGLTTVPIGSTGAIPAPGSVRVYQAWYRDPLPSPCGMGSNLTNALEIRWQ